MIDSPICQPIKTPKATRIRALKFKAFRAKYPSAFYAWVERQSSKSVRRYWAAMMDPYLLPELKVLLTAGHEPVSAQELRDAWYRAAVTCLVHPKLGRVKGDFTETELADAFGIAPGRYRNLVTKERAWAKRTIKPPTVEVPLIAGHPNVKGLFTLTTEAPAVEEFLIGCQKESYTLTPAGEGVGVATRAKLPTPIKGLIAGQPDLEDLIVRLFK